MQITIIDKDEIVCNILMEYLHEKGHELSCAKDLPGAAVLLSCNHYDVILMDPNFNRAGIDIFECLSPDSKKVVVTTDKKLKDHLKADYFLDKPFDLNELDFIIEDIQSKMGH